MGTSIYPVSGGGAVNVGSGLLGDGSLGDPLSLDKAVSVTTLASTGNATVGGTLAVTGVAQAGGYKSSDGTAGASVGPLTVITGIRVKNGLVTTLTGS